MGPELCSVWEGPGRGSGLENRKPLNTKLPGGIQMWEAQDHLVSCLVLGLASSRALNVSPLGGGPGHCQDCMEHASSFTCGSP